MLSPYEALQQIHKALTQGGTYNTVIPLLDLLEEDHPKEAKDLISAIINSEHQAALRRHSPASAFILLPQEHTPISLTLFLGKLATLTKGVFSPPSPDLYFELRTIGDALHHNEPAPFHTRQTALVNITCGRDTLLFGTEPGYYPDPEDQTFFTINLWIERPEAFTALQDAVFSFSFPWRLILTQPRTGFTYEFRPAKATDLVRALPNHTARTEFFRSRFIPKLAAHFARHNMDIRQTL